MAPLEPSDWELINAYADDELPAEDRRAVERRLAGDGAFAAALQEVRSLKANLQALKPAAVQPGLARQRQLVRPVPMAGAATAVAAALFAMAQLLPPSTAADWNEVT